MNTSRAFKVGLFVVIGVGVALVVALGVGIRLRQPDTIAYHTYFNESVQGLEEGAPVKFRGVTIGHVRMIEIAPDHRHVAVTEEFDVTDIRRLGLSGSPSAEPAHFRVPPDLRAQLVSQGLTGVKLVSIDFFDPAVNPPPALPFEVPPNYIPAAQSVIKSLEVTVTKAADKLPELVEAVVASMARLDRVMAKLERDDVSGEVVRVLSHADGVLTEIGTSIRRLDRENVPAKLAATLDALTRTVDRIDQTVAALSTDGGLFASAEKTAGTLDDLGRGTGRVMRDVESTLRDVGEAADAIRVLAEALERDPDMLLKGRAKGKSR